LIFRVRPAVQFSSSGEGRAATLGLADFRW
jgi:hypothetical protein